MSLPDERAIRRVCVFCGSNSGTHLSYRAVALDLGNSLIQSRYGLVYGGGSVGLMGILADRMLEGGGEVIGVIPQLLAVKELLHPGVKQMHVVPSMHARKALMAELSDAFIALPGGYGTFEELLEAITWSQLGIHRKPIGILNVGGFYDPLVGMIDHAIREGFIKPEHRALLVVEQEPAKLLGRLRTHRLPDVRKWIGPEEI